jgi:ubiquinone/menaquinone biosynthesis C-methylase UbiE
MSTLNLGSIEISPAAAAALADIDADAEVFLDRHRRGDWGDVDQKQWQYNDWALKYGHVVCSTYTLSDTAALMVGTSADRSYTHVILQAEYQCQEVDAREGYAQWAASYDHERNPLVAIEEPHVEAILAGLDVATALDVGAGTGRYALKLARRGINVTAIDSSPEMLAVARRAARRQGVTIDFHLGSLEEGLPFKAGQFDLVICALILCHLPDLFQATREFGRVLRPGGYLLITDFHPEVVAAGWRTTFGLPNAQYVLPNMPHSRADYLKAIEEVGFTLLKVIDVPIRDVPEGYIPFQDEVVRESGDKALCLIAFAQKGPMTNC